MEMLLYKNIACDEICRKMDKDFTAAVAMLLEAAQERGYCGDLWHCHIAYLIANSDNPLSRMFELRAPESMGSMAPIAEHDFGIIGRILDFPWDKMDKHIKGIKTLRNYVPVGGTPEAGAVNALASELKRSLRAKNRTQAVQKAACNFYTLHGCGQFGLHWTFRYDDDTCCIVPSRGGVQNMDWIVGYDGQKKELCCNTEAFVSRGSADHVLIFGESGTGKSSSVRGLLPLYGSRGLRMVELYKHQICRIPHIVDSLSKRNYHFIIFMDDLSFEEFEVEYKYLKSVIEGGFGGSGNVLVYATSNRRHLIRETWKDREETNKDVHISDSAQEKISLSDRFGVVISYLAPSKDEYLRIVDELAARTGLDMPKDQLHSEAMRYQLHRGSFSGRGAAQFINHITRESR